MGIGVGRRGQSGTDRAGRKQAPGRRGALERSPEARMYKTHVIFVLLLEGASVLELTCRGACEEAAGV